MVYGIDLGTTNSLIGRGDKIYTDLVSSNVDIQQKRQVPREACGDGVISSYKVNMSKGDSGKLSIACSTIVLRELVDRVKKGFSEVVKDVVISVPAFFTTSQREAVYDAAECAGLNVRALINEPTAAALYVCKDVKDLVVVYDLGGGTFDVSIVDSRTGSYNVVASDGIILGGDDLDKALAAEVLQKLSIPIRLRTAERVAKLKNLMRIAKEKIQKPGITNVEINLTSCFEGKSFVLTEYDYKRIVREVFGKTIDMTKHIVATQLPAYEKAKIVFVGGSAMCPYLREMLAEEVELEEVASDVATDCVVAKGVALYAKMVEEGKAGSSIIDVTKGLAIEDENGKAIVIIEPNTCVPCKNTRTVVNTEENNKLSLKLYQGDSVLVSNMEYIGTLLYDYGRTVKPKDGVVEVAVEVTADGIVNLSAMEVLFGEDFRQTIALALR